MSEGKDIRHLAEPLTAKPAEVDLVDEAIAAVEFALHCWSGDEPPERGSCVEVLQRAVVEIEQLRRHVGLLEANIANPVMVDLLRREVAET